VSGDALPIVPTLVFTNSSASEPEARQTCLFSSDIFLCVHM